MTLISIQGRPPAPLNITYTSSDSTIAQIVDASGNPNPAQGGKIRIRKAGTVTITATQTGNAIYNPVTTGVTQTLTINYYNLFEDSISGMQWWFDAYNVNADSSLAINDQTAFFNWNDMSQNNRNAVQGTLDKMAVYKRMLLAARPRSSLTPQTRWTCLPRPQPR